MAGTPRFDASVFRSRILEIFVQADGLTDHENRFLNLVISSTVGDSLCMTTPSVFIGIASCIPSTARSLLWAVIFGSQVAILW